MMKAWMARTLRRSLLLTAMAFGTQDLLHRAIFARAEFPPASVDRMVVRAPDGSSREISDPEAISRIIAFMRARSEPTRLPENVHPGPMPIATFYRGNVKHGWIAWSRFVFIVPAGDDIGVVPMSRDQAAELQRLMDAAAH